MEVTKEVIQVLDKKFTPSIRAERIEEAVQKIADRMDWRSRQHASA